jgi:hypothetical protein
MSRIHEVDFTTTHSYNAVCFESHLITGLDLPPSKFLVAIMNFLGCELVHFNLNAIAALSYFSMLCECLLEIFIPRPDRTRLFILGLGYLFVATVARNTSMLPSRALGGVLCYGGS